MLGKIQELLGGHGDSLLKHTCTTIPKDMLHAPGPDFLDRVWIDSDRKSPVLRNLGVAFGHSLFAYRRILRGLGKLTVDRERLLDEVRAHPEVLAEAVQTILRRAGYHDPYEALKGLTRGKVLTLGGLRAFVETLDVPEAVKAELRALTPESYTGLAPELARTLRRKT